MLYAGDICIITLSSSGLLQLVNICNDYCELHDLMLKIDVYLFYSIDMNKHCGPPVIYLGNCVLQFIKEVKYLGVMIHSSLRTQPIAASSRSTIWSGGNGLRWMPPS